MNYTLNVVYSEPDEPDVLEMAPCHDCDTWYWPGSPKAHQHSRPDPARAE